MTDDRITLRADHLLPEEQEAGGENPLAMAEAILAESDLRQSSRPTAQDPSIEHRTSAQAAE